MQSASVKHGSVALAYSHPPFSQSRVVQSSGVRQAAPGVPMAQKYWLHWLLRQSSAARQLLSVPPRPQRPLFWQFKLWQSLLVTHSALVNPAAQRWVVGLQSRLRQSSLL